MKNGTERSGPCKVAQEEKPMRSLSMREADSGKLLAAHGTRKLSENLAYSEEANLKVLPMIQPS